MKSLLIVFALSLFAVHTSAQFPVTDLANLEQAIQQLVVTKNQLEQNAQLLSRLGDPGTIQRVVGAIEVIEQIGQPSVGRPLIEIKVAVTGEGALFYDGEGLFAPVAPQIPLVNGQVASRKPQLYRKYEVVQQAVSDLDLVADDVKARREALRVAQQQTAQQLTVASTHAEVQKLTGTLVAQSSELATVTAEQSEAATRVFMQHVSNQEDRARQEQAELELRSASLQSGVNEAMRFFRSDSRPTLIPNPR